MFVDGVRAFSSSFNAPSNGGTTFGFLNNSSPEEIEDVEIVKGPSAATLYGTDAANGVIVITTKKGRAGNSRWSWTAEQGAVSDRNDYGKQYAIWGHAPNGNGSPIRCWLQTMDSQTPCVQDSVTSYEPLRDPDVTPIHLGKRSLYGGQVTGGSEGVRFFVSGNLENEIGPMKMPEFAIRRLDSLQVPIRDEWMYPEALQMMNVRSNLQATISPKIDLSVNAGRVRRLRRTARIDVGAQHVFRDDDEPRKGGSIGPSRQPARQSRPQAGTLGGIRGRLRHARLHEQDKHRIHIL